MNSVNFQRECSTPGEAQEYMLQMLRQYPFNVYDTRINAIPRANSEGLKFTVIGSRKELS